MPTLRNITALGWAISSFLMEVSCSRQLRTQRLIPSRAMAPIQRLEVYIYNTITPSSIWSAVEVKAQSSSIASLWMHSLGNWIIQIFQKIIHPAFDPTKYPLNKSIYWYLISLGLLLQLLQPPSQTETMPQMKGRIHKMPQIRILLTTHFMTLYQNLLLILDPSLLWSILKIFITIITFYTTPAATGTYNFR